MSSFRMKPSSRNTCMSELYGPCYTVYGTIQYHKTKDILYVKERLGHKKIENTLIYTHLINFESDEYTVMVAKNLDEAIKLLEAGFEYITDYGDNKIFRKRK